MSRSPAPRQGFLRGPTGVKTEPPGLADLALPEGYLLKNRWRIGRELGRGGFGAVYEAEDTVLDKQRVALKVLDPLLSRQQGVLERFKLEVVLLRGLSHERIVQVFEYGEDPGRGLVWFTMELVQGISVSSLIEQVRIAGGSADPRLAVEIMGQVLEGLVAVHAKGVVHGDVCPANILLRGANAVDLLAGAARPLVKLVDFGIGDLVEDSERSERMRAHGAAPYLAPEILGDELVEVRLKPAADIFSVGASIFELITGRRAAGSASGFGETASGQHREIRPLIEGMLRRDPRDRPTAPEALAECQRLHQAFERRAQPSRSQVHSNPRVLKLKLKRAMSEEDPAKVREVLVHLKEVLGPAAEYEVEVGIAEAWLLSHG